MKIVVEVVLRALSWDASVIDQQHYKVINDNPTKLTHEHRAQVGESSLSGLWSKLRAPRRLEIAMASIMSWRGADWRNLLSWVDDYSQGKERDIFLAPTVIWDLFPISTRFSSVDRWFQSFRFLSQHVLGHMYTAPAIAHEDLFAGASDKSIHIWARFQ